jgi:quinol monooxygenase YgiN
MIVVIGSVTARADSFELVRQACLDHVHRSRTEDGCISHAVHVDVENPLRLFFFERWRDVASLQQHFRQPGSLLLLKELHGHTEAAETMSVYEASDLPL